LAKIELAQQKRDELAAEKAAKVMEVIILFKLNPILPFSNIQLIYRSVLLIRDVLSWIRTPKFFILDPGGKKAPARGSYCS
jgi:hypothetical protein